MVYDSVREEVLLFGGRDATTDARLSDTWAWNGQEWAERDAVGPSPRSAPGMSYDSTRQVTVLFGGNGESERLGDTWEWDGTQWHERVESTAPASRSYARMAFDEALGVSVLFGGVRCDQCNPRNHDDTWEWDGNQWSLRQQHSAPGPIGSGNMAYDSLRRRVVMYDSNSIEKPTWVWMGGSWTQIQVGDDRPDGPYTLLAYDRQHDAMVTYGQQNELGLPVVTLLLMPLPLPGDCDCDGTPDADVFPFAATLDCDNDGREDSCQLAIGADTDCNGNGVLDACDATPGLGERPENAGPTLCSDVGCEGESSRFEQRAADFIRADADFTVRQVEVNGSFSDDVPYGKSFYLAIHNAFPPSPVFAVSDWAYTVHDTGRVTDEGQTEWQLSFAFQPPIELPAGDYFLEVVEQTPDDAPFRWLYGDPQIVSAIWQDGTWSLSYSADLASGVLGDLRTGDCDQNGVVDACEYDAALDCNGNMLFDECDTVKPGDFNNDRVVDLTDYRFAPRCLGGPHERMEGVTCGQMCVAAFDGNADQDVDLRDLAALLGGNVEPLADPCSLVFDPAQDCDDNGVLDTCDVVPDALDQPSGGFAAACSDVQCIGGVNGPAGAADDFVLTEPATIREIRVRGAVLLGSAEGKSFNVYVHGETLGNVVAQFADHPYTAVATGASLGSQLNEWDIRFAFGDALVLPAGTYWIEVVEQGTGDFGFQWAGADADSISMDGYARRTGDVWSQVPTGGLALSVMTTARSGDCNANDITDACELSPATDSDANGVLDECEW